MQADGERIDSRLQKLADESDIRGVLALYCRAVDHLDYDTLRSVYHPDATDDHAPFFTGDVDAFIDYMRESSTRPLLLTRHSISGTYIELDGPSAASESYFEALHVRVVDGTATDERLFGRYLEQVGAARQQMAHRRPPSGLGLVQLYPVSSIPRRCGH